MAVLLDPIDGVVVCLVFDAVLWSSSLLVGDANVCCVAIAANLSGVFDVSSSETILVLCVEVK